LSARPPDILVAQDAHAIAVRAADGRLFFPLGPKNTFVAARWLERDGDTRIPRQAVGGARCDSESCLMTALGGGLVAMPFRPEAVVEDCAHAAILIAAVPVENCQGPKLVLDSRAAAQGEGYAVTDGKARSVRDWRGNRPWTQ
jgi:hypothetical protein